MHLRPDLKPEHVVSSTARGVVSAASLLRLLGGLALLVFWARHITPLPCYPYVS